MNENLSQRQARAIASLLPTLMHRLFSFDGDQAAELPLAQLRVCTILYGGPRPMSAIGRELGVSLSAMTQIADRLERAQLVNRVPRGADRRIKCLRLTDRGQRMMQVREDARVRRVLAALENLPAESTDEICAALELLLGACASRGGQGHKRQHQLLAAEALP